MDQDSERTSSIPSSVKASSSRRHSRAPSSGLRKDVIAGIDELDALGRLSLRTNNDVAVTNSSSTLGADDALTVIACGARDSDPSAEMQAVTAAECSVSNSGPRPNHAAVSAPALSGVNPTHASGHGSDAKRRETRKASSTATTQLVLWVAALATLFGAVWYVLSQPVTDQPERHWVSGRSR